MSLSFTRCMSAPIVVARVARFNGKAAGAIPTGMRVPGDPDRRGPGGVWEMEEEHSSLMK